MDFGLFLSQWWWWCGCLIEQQWMAVRDRGPIEGGGVGVCDVGVVVVQRAVLVELWRKIVHAALGFPAFALAPPSPCLLCSRRPMAVWLGQYFSSRWVDGQSG